MLCDILCPSWAVFYSVSLQRIFRKCWICKEWVFWNIFVHQQGVSINRILLYIKINRYRSYTIFTDALCLVVWVDVYMYSIKTRYCCENTTKYIVAMTILFKLSILYLCFAPHGRKNISVYPKLTRYDEIYHTQIDWEHPHFWCILLLIYACLISKKLGFE